MTKELKEAAEAYIRSLDEFPLGIRYAMKNTYEFKALKAALRPSKEEIVDYLAGMKYGYI